MIDAHTHFYDPTRPEGVPWPARDDPVLYRRVMPAEFRRIAEPYGVTGTIVVEASTWVMDNQWLLDLASTEPVIYGVVGRLDPEDEDFSCELERFSSNPLFRGIRLGLPRSSPEAVLARPSYQRALRELARLGLTLDLLFEPPAPGLLDALYSHPQLRVVLDHAALAPDEDDRPDAAWQRWLDAARELPHVYWKLSGFSESALQRSASVPTDPGFYYPVFDTMLEHLGPARLLYASNWPVSERAMSYHALCRIVQGWTDQLDHGVRARIFHHNAVEAYGLLRNPSPETG